MAKLQVRLLVLIALGTGTVTSSILPPWDCGRQKDVTVSSDEIEVKVPNSNLAFYRVTVTDFQLQFAMKSNVSLPSDSLLECAIAAAREGVVAFAFDGNCTGYILNLHFYVCQTGDRAVFVLPTYLDAERLVVPMDEAPYQITEDVAGDYRTYMLSGYVKVKAHQSYKKTDKFEEVFRSNPKNNFVFLENGDIMYSNYLLLDVNSCLTSGAYGLQVVVSPELYEATIPTVYFFEECGKRIQVPNSSSAIKMLMFSHRGFGCKRYPSALRDQCFVVFEGEGSQRLNAEFGFIFPQYTPRAGGLIMDVQASIEGQTFGTDMYKAFTTKKVRNKLRIRVIMHRQPTTPPVGFFMAFF